MSIALFLWFSILKNNQTIENYNLVDLISYYILVPLVGFFINNNFSSSVGTEIKDGILSNHLIKPMNIKIYYYFRIISQKFNQISIVLPFYLLIIFLVLNFILKVNPFNIINLLIASVFIIFAFHLSFFLELCFSFAAFWIDEVWSFEHFKVVALSIFGGLLLPIDFFPKSIKPIIELLPFKFFYFTPINIILGKSEPKQILFDFILLLFWIGFFYFFSSFLLKKGIKMFNAYGN